MYSRVKVRYIVCTISRRQAHAMSLSVLFGPLRSLLGAFQSERHYKDEKKDAALLAINQALIETKRYIEKSDSKNLFDRDEEYKLAHLWAEAATKARYASSQLAERLQNKALYWSEELKWSSEEVLSKQIDIDSIQEQVLDLLKH
jgi:hypothetical protein